MRNVIICLLLLLSAPALVATDYNEIEVTGTIVGLKEYDPPIQSHGETWLRKVTIDVQGVRHRLYETPDSVVPFDLRVGQIVTAHYEPFKNPLRGCLESIQ